MEILKIKNVELKENEKLRIGYFNEYGNECFRMCKYQLLSYSAFESIKKNFPNIELIKVEDGYATKFIYENVYLKEI